MSPGLAPPAAALPLFCGWRRPLPSSYSQQGGMVREPHQWWRPPSSTCSLRRARAATRPCWSPRGCWALSQPGMKPQPIAAGGGGQVCRGVYAGETAAIKSPVVSHGALTEAHSTHPSRSPVRALHPGIQPALPPSAASGQPASRHPTPVPYASPRCSPPPPFWLSFPPTPLSSSPPPLTASA